MIRRRRLIQMLLGAGGFGAARGFGVVAEASPALPQAATGTPDSEAREKVVGIGGFFFKSSNPRALAAWYKTHLGVTPPPTKLDSPVWQTEAGTTLFTPFPADTDYFGEAKQMFMVNFRVKNLARMVTQLTAAGIAVKVDPQEYPNGRFAHLHDPDGNPVELWEPKG